MSILLEGIVIGVVATIGIDLWALFVKHVLRLPTAHWDMVGRWFGHLAKGVLVHRPIASSPAIPNELALGWIGHYAIGVFYGVAYLAIVAALPGGEVTVLSALAFGLATLFAPWLIMQPAMGAGVFASRTPRPWAVRLVNVSMHALFGLLLYFAWEMIR